MWWQFFSLILEISFGELNEHTTANFSAHIYSYLEHNLKYFQSDVVSHCGTKRQLSHSSLKNVFCGDQDCKCSAYLKQKNQTAFQFVKEQLVFELGSLKNVENWIFGMLLNIFLWILVFFYDFSNMKKKMAQWIRIILVQLMETDHLKPKIQIVSEILWTSGVKTLFWEKRVWSFFFYKKSKKILLTPNQRCLRLSKCL